MSTAAPMAIPPTGPAAAGSHPERANSLSAAAPATSSSSYRQVGAGSGLSPAPSSLFSSASPMTPSPILASALSLPGGRSTGTFAFNPFFSTSPKTFAGAGPLASSPSSAATYGAHQRSFSIAGGAGDGKPILVSGFPGGSAVADDDDDEPSPPASTRASLGGGGHPPFGLPPLRRPSQPVKLPAQLQSQIKPPSASLGPSNAPAASSAPTASGKPTPALQTMNAPVGSTADNGGGGSQAGAGRGHGVLRRLSLGAGSLLSRVRPILSGCIFVLAP
jgi:hypothetical protein